MVYQYLIPLDYISLSIRMIGHINSNLPDDFQELISVSQSKYAKYKPVKDIYTKALHKNVTVIINSYS